MSPLVRRSTRAVATAVLAAWAASGLLAVAHSGHAHRYCVEHQVIEEGADDPPAPTHDGAGLDACAAQAHELCPFFAALVKDTVAGAPARVSRATTADECAAVAGERSARPPLRLLAVAPKASPPVA